MSNPLKDFEDSIKKRARKLDDDLNISENAAYIILGPQNYVAAETTGAKAAYDLLTMDAPAIPEIPNAPTFDQARAIAEQNRRKRGKASTILSERPSSPMGYTGGGYVSGAQLLGSA